MQEPNAEINAAARLIRHQVENWRSEAAEHLSCAAQTSWGRSVIEDNPTYKKVIEQLKGAQPLDRTARMGILQDVESLHSFAGMINRTPPSGHPERFLCAPPAEHFGSFHTGAAGTV